MRHLNGYRKLGRKSEHRRALLRNMATSLLLHERINTTLPKAKELRSVVEKIITMGKNGDLGSRRRAASYIFDSVAVDKVFGDLAARFQDRQGGYTRILKRGIRLGDSASMAIIEFVDYLDQKNSNKDSKKSDATSEKSLGEKIKAKISEKLTDKAAKKA